ncbi:DNA cytosine methyltransferase [Alkalibacillus aidingensis]|uniref:DNA cytosine methyltransferase n=1 Tax=Alkalibacillus aidingensis TaxID=2747607 RepID=UPI0016609541|nr:DNA cytosine methyltransferase [Alkalibacillus aidingensis]
MNKKLKVVSLFSGIGGFEFGLRNSKIETELVFSSEIDKFAQYSYETLFGFKPEGDITEIHEFLIPDHDLLTAGFPCQAFSVAGKRLGFEDTRGTLFFDIARILDWKKPKYVLLENVKNLISHDQTNTIKTILQVLSDIGYSIDFDIINSKDYGVPQNRERTYIIGVLDGPLEPWEQTSSSNQVNKIKQHFNETNSINTFNFNFNPNVHKDSKISNIQSILESNVPESFFLDDMIVEKLNKIGQVTDISEESDKIVKLFDIPKSLHNDNERQRRVYSPHGIAPTVLARTDAAKILVNDSNNYRIRKITPFESFRLQGFSTSTYQKLLEANLSNTQLYKQAGNAVTVNVVESIANSIYERFLEKVKNYV